MVELETLKVFEFGKLSTTGNHKNLWNFGTFVELMNNELDQWTPPPTFPGKKVHHWRHFHLPLMSTDIMQSLCGMDFEEFINWDTMRGLTRSLSELSLGSVQLVDPPEEEEDTFSDEGRHIFSDPAPLYFHTTFGTKFHTFADCKGLNGRPYTATLEYYIPQGRTLCLLCKARQEALSTPSGTTFGRNFQGSVVETTLPASSSTAR